MGQIRLKMSGLCIESMGAMRADVQRRCEDVFQIFGECLSFLLVRMERQSIGK